VVTRTRTGEASSSLCIRIYSWQWTPWYVPWRRWRSSTETRQTRYVQVDAVLFCLVRSCLSFLFCYSQLLDFTKINLGSICFVWQNPNNKASKLNQLLPDCQVYVFYSSQYKKHSIHDNEMGQANLCHDIFPRFHIVVEHRYLSWSPFWPMITKASSKAVIVHPKVKVKA